MTQILDRSIPPVIHQIDKIELPSPSKNTLSNGIPVIGFNLGSQEVVHIQLIFDGGTKRQLKNLEAGYTNKLIGEASNLYKQGEISSKIDYYGAFFEHSMSKDFAALSLYTPTKYIQEVLPVFAEAILHPKFEQEIFETHISNGKHKQKIALEKVATIARNEFFNLLFENHPYGSKIKLEDYDLIQLSDLELFYKNHYTRENCTIFISGKYDDSLLQQLETAFSILPSGKSLKSIPFKNNSPAKKEFFLKEGAIQSGIRIGKVLDVEFGSQDYFDLKIANMILGGYFGSRLMSNIREDKGYTYGINSGIGALEQAIYFSIATEVGANVTHSAIEEIYKEMQILSQELVSEKELEMVKNYMLGSILKASDGPFSIEELYKSIYFKGETLDFFNTYVHRINQIQPNDVLTVFNKYLSAESLLEVVAGKKNN